MAEATRLVSIGRGIDPRGYALLPLGGAGPLHACALAEELGISRIVIPPHPGVLSAAGLLGARVEHEMSAAFPCKLAELQAEALDTALEELDGRCGALMQQEGVTDAEIRHFADLCYVGQSYFLEVPLDTRDADGIYRAFLAAHQRVYGHSTEVPAKIVNLRTVHRSPAGTAAVGVTTAARAGTPASRRIVIRGGAATAAVWQRETITPDATIPGPAIIEQNDTTTLVEPGWTARLTTGGTLLLERMQ
jgi:N-methylhydantoinase A/oxoprolinase/acetone carboxylase beta subunit